jgi:hypothetical protein
MSEKIARLVAGERHYLALPPNENPQLWTIDDVIEHKAESVLLCDLRRAYRGYLRIVGDHGRQFWLKELAKLAGIQPNTMDVWTRSGIVRASVAGSRGNGADRRFDFLDGFVAGVSGTLRRHGAGYALMAQAADLLYATFAPEKAPVPILEAN